MPADPGCDLGQCYSGPNRRGITIAHIAKVFVKVTHDFAAPVERRQNIDKPKHLDLEMFIAHRERHHPLVKAGFAENRLGVLVYQLENALTAGFDFVLQRAH